MRKSKQSSPPPFTAALDRGPARYFHGRKEILRNFRQLLDRSEQVSSGTIFLIQGAPGVGKTALLDECVKRAIKNKWRAVKIHPNALWNTGALMQLLGRGGEYEITEKTGEPRAPILKAAYKSVPIENDTLKILWEEKHALLLWMDEVQKLENIKNHSQDKIDAASLVLEAIHNGELGSPIILAAAGLQGARKAFENLGVSRFARDCFVELGPLSKESERSVIQDWLQKEGGAKEDPTSWIDAIAQETHGWPHHILSYVYPAAKHLRAEDGIMVTEGLESVLESGRVGRRQYYRQRVDDFFGDELQCLARSLPDSPSHPPVSRTAIMSSLTKKYGDIEAKQLFDSFVQKGILKKKGVGLVVPIPSMHAWLVSNYALDPA